MSDELAAIATVLTMILLFFWAARCAWELMRFATWPFRAAFGIVRNVIELRRLRRGELPTGSMLPVVKRSAKPKEKC